MWSSGPPLWCSCGMGLAAMSGMPPQDSLQVRPAEAYVGWARRFILFHRKRHPSEMGEAEVTAFLTHLAQVRGVSASTQNQALCALLFLYRHVLGRLLGALEGLVWAKRSTHVPVVLTPDEVVCVLDRLSGTPWLVAALLYGGGLRLSECLELRVKDLDVGGHQIVVRGGKGQKDRRTTLPESLGEALEEHLAARGDGGCSAGGPRQAGVVPYVPALVCDASAGKWGGHSYGARTTGSSGCDHDDGVYPRPKSRAVGSAESGGSAASKVGHQPGRAPSGSARFRLTNIRS